MFIDLSLFRPKLQQALISSKFNEGYIAAVLVAALYHYGGNLSSAATHLHGLSIMLAYDQQRRLRAYFGSSPASAVSFIKRQYIRFFDQLPSTRQKLLEIAPTVGTQDWDTRWTPNFTPLALVLATDAAYALQDFQYAVLYSTIERSKCGSLRTITSRMTYRFQHKA